MEQWINTFKIGRKNIEKHEYFGRVILYDDAKAIKTINNISQNNVYNLIYTVYI